MAQPTIQTSFNSGEWAPALNARVDLQKYQQGAALLRNFFVDYRGGATARGGTKYILKTRSDSTVRLINFQASLGVGYVLEFGEGYVRFYADGAPILEPAIAITAATQANPLSLTISGNYALGDWFYVSGVGGMTQLNGNYYITNGSGGNFPVDDLFGDPVDASAYTAYTAGGTASRVYTLASPYLATELAQLKFTQNVDTMIICHPNHPPYELILTSPASWTLTPITFGSTAATPTGTAGGSSGAVGAAGTVYYAYVVTSVDESGQESAPTAPILISAILDIRAVAGSLTVSWSAAAGAVSYNVYRAEIRYGASPPTGAAYGYVGNTTGLLFVDSNIIPDFSIGYPQIRDPFSGTGVQTLTLTSGGTTYLAVPAVTLTASPGVTATASATVGIYQISIDTPGSGYAVNDIIGFDAPSYGATGIVTAVSFGQITAMDVYSPGAVSSIGTAMPANARNCFNISTSSPFASGARVNLFWNVTSITLASPGTGYGLTPSVTFTGGSPGAAATATATLGSPSSGNPTVPGFFQQRLILAGPVASPQQFNASQPGAYYNFNVSIPLLPSDAFEGTLQSGQLNNIQSLVSQPQGLIVLSDRQAWLINGGSPGSGIDATNTVANAHIFNGAGNPPPIVAVDDILYVQAKNSIVRDLIYDFNKQVYTGKDISVLSSHLFYGYQVLEWAFAEEPFKLIWAVRSDGQLLCLTFLKEQELCAWTHADTNGLFKSVASVTEDSVIGEIDATYFVVQRVINGNSVQYVERMTELYYPTGVTDAWCVDSGLQYNGVATLSFSGAQHLVGFECTGLATDDTGAVTIITPFTMAASGNFTLPAPTAPATGYTRVTLGLAYLPQLQTLAIDLGEPTVQGKMKKIAAVTVRVNQTLGLQIGSDFDNLVDMKDLVRGNVGKDTNELVTDLVTGDALEAIDPTWSVPGQYCIQQTYPFPASILGVIPQVTVGDTKGKQG